MASFGPVKRIIGAGMDHNDIISDLPWEIKDKILTKLPIKEAVRTSILSTKWRYTWATISEIVLRDNELVPDVDGPAAIYRLVRIVDLLLFLHKGPIFRFNLSTKHLCSEAFDRWILNLSRNGITELTFLLNLAYNTWYRIPSNFFFCILMQDLHLSKCSIKLPCGFEGFKLLKTLELDNCSIPAVDIEKLVSSSTQLVWLSLRHLYIIGNLYIHAKKLKWLKIKAVFSNLQVDAPQLISARISLDSQSNGKPFLERPGSANNLCQILGSLLNIEDLMLSTYLASSYRI